MNLKASKSHSVSELIAAHKAGKQLVFLDSGTSGHDDILILEIGETLDDLKQEVDDWLDQDPDEPSVWDEGPNPWSIRILDHEEVEGMIVESEESQHDQ